MRSHKCFSAGLMVLALLTIATRSADAQTTAVGPYYATPSWDQKLACSSASNCPRFVVLSNWNNEAVLDRETGLVWQRTPDQILRDWSSATDVCRNRIVAHRAGWRLPNIDEIQSLVDDSGGSAAIKLPAGHPFLGITTSFFWSETTREGFSDIPALTRNAYVYSFSPEFAVGLGEFMQSSNVRVWCVRGPGGVPSQ